MWAASVVVALPSESARQAPSTSFLPTVKMVPLIIVLKSLSNTGNRNKFAKSSMYLNLVKTAFFDDGS